MYIKFLKYTAIVFGFAQPLEQQQGSAVWGATAWEQWHTPLVPDLLSQLNSSRAPQCGGQQAGSSGRLVRRSVRRGAPAPPPEP